MNKIFSMLAEDANFVPDWIVASFPVLRIIFVIIMALCAVALIVVILLQSHSTNNINALSGGQESYYSQNKSQTKDGRLKKLTIILASILASSVVLFYVSLLVYSA